MVALQEQEVIWKGNAATENFVCSKSSSLFYLPLLNEKDFASFLLGQVRWWLKPCKMVTSLRQSTASITKYSIEQLWIKLAFVFPILQSRRSNSNRIYLYQNHGRNSLSSVEESESKTALTVSEMDSIILKRKPSSLKRFNLLRI